jgi:hypothetical protein
MQRREAHTYLALVERHVWYDAFNVLLNQHSTNQLVAFARTVHFRDGIQHQPTPPTTARDFVARTATRNQTHTRVRDARFPALQSFETIGTPDDAVRRSVLARLGVL